MKIKVNTKNTDNLFIILVLVNNLKNQICTKIIFSEEYYNILSNIVCSLFL